MATNVHAPNLTLYVSMQFPHRPHSHDPMPLTDSEAQVGEEMVIPASVVVLPEGVELHLQV